MSGSRIYQLITAVMDNDIAKVSECVSACKKENISIDALFNWASETKHGLSNEQAFNLINLGGLNALYLAALKGHSEVVDILLKNGANPNLSLGTHDETPLHVAAKYSHKDTVYRLIQGGANTKTKNAAKLSPLNYAKQPAIIRLLKIAGGDVELNQKYFIKNYNLLVPLFKNNKIIELEPIQNGDAVCNGLCKIFIFYEKQGRSDEFQFFITYVNSLDTQSIQELIDACRNKKNIRLKLPHQQTDANAPSYSFNKLLDFLQAVKITQRTQNQTYFKSIGANWEESHVVGCASSELVNQLKVSGILRETGYKFISTSSHLMALHVIPKTSELLLVPPPPSPSSSSIQSAAELNEFSIQANAAPEGGIFYEPNNVKGPILCNNESELAQALIPAINRQVVLSKQSVAPNDVRAELYIYSVSYGDTNREFDDFLKKHEDFIMKQENMRSLVLHYQQGNLSRRDAVFTLYRQLKSLDSKIIQKYASLQQVRQDIVQELQDKCLTKYQDNNHCQNVIPDTAIGINDQTNKFRSTLLHRACAIGNLETVQQLLDAGADVNVIDSFGRTPLQAAKLDNHNEIVLILKQHQPVDDIVKNSGMQDDDPIATKINKLLYSYAHPPFLSTHWRSHRPLADHLANEFSGNECKNWNADECSKHITKATKDLNINETGTFKGLLRRIDYLIKHDQKPEINQDQKPNKKDEDDDTHVMTM